MSYVRAPSPVLGEIGIGHDLPAKPVTRPWLGRAIALACIGGSLASIFTAHSRWTDSIGAISLGAASFTLVDSFVPPESRLHFYKVALTLFGQSFLFGASQIWGNTTNESLERACVLSIIGTLGVWGAVEASKSARNLSETALDAEEGAQEESTFRVFLGEKPTAALKAAAGLAFTLMATNAFRVQALAYPAIKIVTSFFASFFLAGLAGQYAAIRLANRIKRDDNETTAAAFAEGNIPQGSLARRIRDILLPIGCFGLPLALCVSSFHPTAKETAIRGAFVGVFQSFLSTLWQRKLKGHPIRRLIEFQSLPDSRPFNIFRHATMFLVVSGTAAFVATQEKFGDLGAVSQKALGIFFGSFLATLLGTRLIDEAWDIQKRQNNRSPSCGTHTLDWLMIRVQSLVSILGCPPAYAYSVFASALVGMDNQEIDKEGPTYQTLAIIAWFFYGMGWGAELANTLSQKRGPGRQVVPMILVGAITTLIRFLARRID